MQLTKNGIKLDMVIVILNVCQTLLIRSEWTNLYNSIYNLNLALDFTFVAGNIILHGHIQIHFQGFLFSEKKNII